MTDIRARPTPWTTVLLTCGKCARKLDGGFGEKGKKTLRSALRSELKAAGHGRSVRVIETRCLGLCPRGAVVALNASRPDRVLTVPKKAPIAELLVDLAGPAPASA